MRHVMNSEENDLYMIEKSVRGSYVLDRRYVVEYMAWIKKFE